MSHRSDAHRPVSAATESGVSWAINVSFEELQRMTDCAKGVKLITVGHDSGCAKAVSTVPF